MRLSEKYFAEIVLWVGMSGSSGALYGLIPQRNPTFTLIVGFRGGFWYAEAVANRPSTQPYNYLQSFNQDQAWVVLIPDL